MPGDVDVAAVAALLADPTRVGMIYALSDGKALPAGDLARLVRVSPSTASNHLTKLVEHQWLTVEQQGRHRYFRLADPAIMSTLEALAIHAPPVPIRSLRDSEAGRAIRAARMCYNHLAGRLGVALTQSTVARGFLIEIEDGYLVTGVGERWLQSLGIDGAALKKHGQIFAPAHVDWSERRHHMAGALGAAVARCALEHGWVRRLSTSRAVGLTAEGKAWLQKDLGVLL